MSVSGVYQSLLERAVHILHRHTKPQSQGWDKKIATHITIIIQARNASLHIRLPPYKPIVKVHIQKPGKVSRIPISLCVPLRTHKRQISVKVSTDSKPHIDQQKTPKHAPGENGTYACCIPSINKTHYQLYTHHTNVLVSGHKYVLHVRVHMHVHSMYIVHSYTYIYTQNMTSCAAPGTKGLYLIYCFYPPPSAYSRPT